MIAGSSQVVWPVVLYQYGLPKVGSVAIVHSMVIVGVSTQSLVRNADIAVVARTRPSGAIAGGACPGGIWWSVAATRVPARLPGSARSRRAKKHGLGPTQSPPAVLLEPLSFHTQLHVYLIRVTVQLQLHSIVSSSPVV